MDSATADTSENSGAGRKVLIAVDLSSWAEMAFRWYARHLHVSGTEVICFHLGEMPHISPVEAYGLAADAYNNALEGCKDTAKRVQDTFVSKMNQYDIQGRILIKYGSRPGEAIIDISRAEEVSMIVMGTRGLGQLRRTVLGSVSDYVLHHAQCPVVVCSHGTTSSRSRSTSISEET